MRGLHLLLLLVLLISLAASSLDELDRATSCTLLCARPASFNRPTCNGPPFLPTSPSPPPSAGPRPPRQRRAASPWVHLSRQPRTRSPSRPSRPPGTAAAARLRRRPAPPPTRRQRAQLRSSVARSASTSSNSRCSPPSSRTPTHCVGGLGLLSRLSRCPPALLSNEPTAGAPSRVRRAVHCSAQSSAHGRGGCFR